MPELQPRALICDVDGTLYSARALRWRLAWRLMGAGPEALRALRAFRQALEQLRAGPPPGRIPDCQYALAARLARLTEERVRAHVARWFEAAPLPLLRRCRRPGIEALLAAAQERGIACGVFSDYPVEAKLEALGLSGRFAAAAWAGSAEVQAYKPSPRGLRHVAEKLGVKPEEALHIGDRAGLDDACGMKTLLVRRDFDAVRSMLGL